MYSQKYVSKECKFFGHLINSFCCAVPQTILYNTISNSLAYTICFQKHGSQSVVGLFLKNTRAVEFEIADE